MNDLVQFIQQYASAHYESGGWDVIVECYTEREIAEVLSEAGAISPRDAIEAFSFVVDVWADRQADARNSAF